MSKTLAFVFPGQGSQSVGMLSDLAVSHPCVIETFLQASDVLGYDLWDLVCHDPLDQLNQTEFTQPALMAASVAMWRIYCAENAERPALLAGHSLGEFVALVCAGAMQYSDAVRLVALRGRFMQEAVAEGVGAMAAIIGLDNDRIAALCQSEAQGDIVAPANFNSIGQVVIAGALNAVQRVIDQAKLAGAKMAKMIPVSVPSHCALMQPAAERLAKSLAEINIESPQIPLIQNVDAKIHTNPSDIRQNLVDQLVRPVQWVATIQAMQAEGITRITECGPGNVLRGLIKRISKDFILT